MTIARSRNSARTGNIMLVTLGVVLVIAFLLANSADNMIGAKRSNDTSLAREKAMYAAEAVAAQEEETLVNLAGSNDLAKLESLSPNYGTQWLGDCVVRWRIEPVRVTNSNSNWTVNPPSDVSLYGAMGSYNSQYTGAATDGTYLPNYDYYVFRIATEAFALKDPSFSMKNPDGTVKADSLMPWSVGDLSLARVQTSRVIQLKLNSLFKYALFYAAEGPDGDIEFHPGSGATMYIPGAVHSNGAIYLAGGSSPSSSAPPLDAGGVEIGGAGSGLGQPTTVVGVKGVYRLRKSLDILNGVVNPYSVPLNSVLNGGLGTKFVMNDNPLLCANDGSYCNDSRNPDELQKVYSTYVRDGVTLGATVVKTLSNIPDLAGRPFEQMKQAPNNMVIYAIDSTPANLMNPTNWTIQPGHYAPAPVQLYYRNPAAGNYSIVTKRDFTTPLTGATVWTEPDPHVPAVYLSQAISAGGLPLYTKQPWAPADPNETDIHNPSAATTNGFSDNEKRGVYMDDAITGKPGDGTVGLTIRERPAQDLSYWPNANVPSGTAPYANLLIAKGIPANGLRPEPQWPIFGNQKEYKESGGKLVIEAEHYTGTLNSPFQWWRPYANAAWSNGQGVEVYPDMGRSRSRASIIGATRLDFSPRLDYNIKIVTAGTYKICTLGFAPSAGSDTIHVGFSPLGSYALATDFPSTADNIQVNTAATPTWMNHCSPNTTSGASSGTVVLPVGEFVLHVWMSEDGVRLDEICLTTGAAPSGTAALAENTTVAASALGGTLPVMPVDYESAMVQYMKSQYVAYFGNTDLTVNTLATTGFFGYNSAAAVNNGGLVAFESDMVDRRESDYLRQFFGGDTTSSDRAYRCNLLTLNLNNIQNYVRATYLATFNGLIYAGRARRSNGYNPVLFPLWNPANYNTSFGGWTPSQAWYEDRFNNRVPDGPDCVFHEAIRIAQGATIDWGGVTGGASSRKRGITIVTPNHCYIQGDFNVIPDYSAMGGSSTPLAAPPSPLTVPYMESQLQRANPGYGGPFSALTGAQLDMIKFPPCAVFADQLTALSNSWNDANTVYESNAGGTETWFNVSAIINNVPSEAINKDEEGSGGTHNVVRFLEDWGGNYYHFRGSLVCMNRAKYTRGGVCGGQGGTMSAYGPPKRDLRFNTDLLTRAGQPPFTPFGVNVIRTVSTINDGD